MIPNVLNTVAQASRSPLAVLLLHSPPMSRANLQQVTQLASAGKLIEADRACRQILQGNPGNTAAARLLGQITRRTGRATESVQIFRHLRQNRPNDIQLLGELGASLAASEQPQLALPLLIEAVEKMPTAVQWKVWLGKCYLKLFKTAAAIKVLKQAREDAPDDPDVLYHLANALLTSGQPAHAEPLILEFLQKRPDSVHGKVCLANIYEHENRLDEAVEICKAIIEKDPTMDAALGTLARCLRTEGKYDEALAILKPLIDAEPTSKTVLAVAPIYLAAKRFEECKSLFKQVLKQEYLPNPVKSSLTFGLAQCHQGLKDYDAAFRAFKRGNEYYPKGFKREHRLTLYQEIRTTFSPEILRDGPRGQVDASKCIFVLGMPRSGTSLIEQILDAHPRVFGAGELPEVPFVLAEICKQLDGPAPRAAKDATEELLTTGAQRYLDHIAGIAPEAEYIIDKLPHNFEMIGLIRRMLPGAKIIHCKRNPIDNCISCYFTQLSAWHSYSNDLSHLGWAYGQYQKLMDYWKNTCGIEMLDVQYEEVIADTEAQARRLLDAIGLEWDPRCLRFYETERRVTTASVDQVRQPIYTSSVARWKRFGDHVTPLIESLKAAGVELADV